MIVKNESRIITRCLTAAKPILDFISICDTGSTDNTIDLIHQWGKQNNIPTTVHQVPFKDFGYNRTLSFQLAEKTYVEATYFILLDADMVLEINPKFNKKLLKFDKITLDQYNTSIRYANVRLIKKGFPWECVGVTHEYWDAPDMTVSSGHLDSLVIDDREDGGCKSDKYERDERLLRAGIADPNTKPFLRTRYYFYLAETLHNRNKQEEAIEFYRKRIQAEGWIEEIFYSWKKIGECYRRLANTVTADLKKKQEQLKTIQEKLVSFVQQPAVGPTGRPTDGPTGLSNDGPTDGPTDRPIDTLTDVTVTRPVGPVTNPIDEKKIEIDQMLKLEVETKDQIRELTDQEEMYLARAQHAYLKAWDARPVRAESLYKLTEMWRERGQNRLAYMFASIGKDIAYPKEDRLFVDYRVYEYLFDFEISIVAFYLDGKKAEGKRILQRLLRKKDKIAPYYRAIIESNAKFYVDV